MSDIYSLSQKRDELTWKYNRLKDIVERDQCKIKEIDTLEATLLQYNQEMGDSTNRRNMIHDLIEDDHELSLIEDQIYELSRHIDSLNNEYVEVLEKYNALKDRQLEIYAGLLAHNLKSDQPCPVCGSKQHPIIAEVIDDTTNEVELEIISQKYNRLRDQRTEEIIALDQLKIKHEDKLKTISRYKIQLEIEEELSKELLTNMLYTIDRQTQRKLSQYKKDENELIYLKKLSKSVKDSLSLLEEYQKEIDEIETQIKTIQE